MDDWREVPISQNEKKNIMIRSKLTYYPFAFYPGTEMAHFDQSYNYWLPVSGTEMAHFDQSYNYWFGVWKCDCDCFLKYFLLKKVC